MRVRILLTLAGILIATPAMTAPIDDVTVSPLPGPASCYAGTPGPDHTIFLKGKSSEADCDVVGWRLRPGRRPAPRNSPGEPDQRNRSGVG